MGVKGFNKIIEKYGKQINNVTINHIVIDGSNLIIRMIASAVSIMKKNYKFPAIDIIDLDIFHQYKFIIDQSIELCKSFINKLGNTASIAIVIDGESTPVYEIYSDPDFVSKALVVESESLSDSELLKLNNLEPSELIELKKDEETRRRETFKTSFNSKFHPSVLSDVFPIENKELIEEIYKQASTCVHNTNTFCLKRIICYYLKEYYKDIEFIEAISEGDLVIKYIANCYDDTENILIISADTDYYVLFSENINVYCMNCMIGSPIYQPFQIWFDYIGTSSVNYTVRAACLFGNDFTMESIIYADKNGEDLRILFGLTHDDISKRKKVFEIYSRMVYNEFNFIEALDRAVKCYNEEFYTKYQYCINIYKTMTFANNKFKNFNTDLMNEFGYLFNKLNIKTFYSWNASKIITDKESFIKSIVKTIVADEFEFQDQIEYANVSINSTLENPEDEYFG
jgi:hypothetical protein